MNKFPRSASFSPAIISFRIFGYTESTETHANAKTLLLRHGKTRRLRHVHGYYCSSFVIIVHRLVGAVIIIFHHRSRKPPFYALKLDLNPTFAPLSQFEHIISGSVEVLARVTALIYK